MMESVRAGKTGLRTILFASIVAAVIGATYLAAAAEVAAEIDIETTDVNIANRRWVSVTVWTPQPSAVTFEVVDGDGETVFEWSRVTDGDYDFEWRGRSTDGTAVPSGTYTLTITAPGVEQSAEVRVRNNAKRADRDGPPAAPADLVVRVGVANHLLWNASTSGDAVSYRVYRATGADGPWEPIANRAPEGMVDAPPEVGIVWYRVSAVDVSGNEGEMSPAVSSDHVSMSQIIGSDGGVLAPTTGTIRLEIPAGAVATPTEFAIEQVSEPPGPNVNRVMVTRGFEITPHGTDFAVPAVLTLRYDIPGQHALPTGYPEDTTIVQYWAETGWRTVPDGAVDREAQTITVQLEHLSLYQGAAVTDPHGGYSDGTNLCGQCHTVHNAPGSEYLYARATQKETCYQCHDGTGANTDIRGDFGESVLGASTKTSFHPVPTPTDGFSQQCNDCHTPHKLKSAYTKLLRLSDGAGGWDYSPTDAPIGNDYCYTCHGAGSAFPDPLGDHTSFQGGVHETLGGVPPSGSGIQCVLCHEPHGSDKPGLSMQEQTCYGCHNAATPNTNPDLPFTDTELEYAFSAGTNDYDATDADGLIRIYHHPIADGEQDGGNRQVECASCHNSHIVDRDYSPTTSKLSDPTDTRSDWIVTWVPPDQGDSPSYTRGNISQFCVKCHQTASVTAPINAGTWVPYDVRLTDDRGVAQGSGEPHDRFDADDYFNNSDHGSPADGDLACTACHDPHGSSNAFMLRENVISVGGVGGPNAGTVGPDITGFDDSWTTGQRDIYADFCGSCHQRRKHKQNQVCATCHGHGGSDF